MRDAVSTSDRELKESGPRKLEIVTPEDTPQVLRLEQGFTCINNFWNFFFGLLYHGSPRWIITVLNGWELRYRCSPAFIQISGAWR